MAARQNAEMSESSGTVRPAGYSETQKPRQFRGTHSLADTCTKDQLPDQGTNLCGISRENQVVDGQGGTESGTLSGELLITDSRLALLIEVWPALSADAKGQILTLAGLRPYDVDDFNDVIPATLTARE